MAETDTPNVPTAEELAAARETLLRAAAATADEARAAMIGFVTSETFGAAWSMMTEAQRLNPSNAELSYAISMFDRLRSSFTPA